jgi:hypothetical protein
MKEKKKFKDTKVGKWLSTNAPDILDTVDDYFPPAKILTSIVKGSTLSDEKKIEFEKIALEYEQNERRDFLADKANARTRETDFVKALGHVDWMMYFVGIIGLSAFGFILYVLVYTAIPEANRDLFIHAIGMVEGVAVSIFSYYFGSSKGSSDKTKLMKQ